MGKELFTEEFKMMVVQYVLQGHTRKETSEKFGVSCTPIKKWVNLYKIHGAKGLLSRNHSNLQGKSGALWIPPDFNGTA